MTTVGPPPAASVEGAATPAAPAAPPADACLNCGTSLSGPYCAACGQRHREGRLTLRGIAEDLAAQVFNLDRGLWPTIAGLTKRPGAVIRDYIEGRRRRYVGPVGYVFFAGAFALLTIQFSEQMDMAWVQEQVDTFTRGPDPIFSARQGEAYRRYILASRETQAAMPLVMTLPFVLLVRVFFRRSGINIAEAAVFALYVLGHALVVFTLLEPVLGPLGHRWVRTTVAFLVGSAIAAHAGLTFFSPRPWTAVRMALAYFLSLFTVSLGGILFILAFVR